MSIYKFKMSNGRFGTHFVKKTFEMCRHQNMQMQSSGKLLLLLWGLSGVTLGSIWGHFGVDLGAKRGFKRRLRGNSNLQNLIIFLPGRSVTSPPGLLQPSHLKAPGGQIPGADCRVWQKLEATEAGAPRRPRGDPFLSKILATF